MSLILKVISPATLPTGQLPEFSFDTLGGSIGRKPSNDFVLIDPERFISSQHAIIECKDGDFFITDTSTNGVFINNAKRPIGTGNSQALTNGDKISIGEFQLESILINAQNTTDESLIPAPFTTPAATPIADDLFDFNEPLIQDNTTSSSFNDMDPLALLGDTPSTNTLGMGGGINDSVNSGFQSQEAPFASSPASSDTSNNGFFDDIISNPHQNIPEPLPINEPFTPPSAIPDDWDIMGDDFSSSQPTASPAVSPAAPTAPIDSIFSDSPLANADFPEALFPKTEIENTTPLIPENDNFLDNFEEDDIFASLSSSALPTSALPTDAQPLHNAPQTSTETPLTTRPQPAPQSFAPTPAIASTPHNSNTPPNNRELLDAFIIGAGLDPAQIKTDNPKELLTKLGQLTRTSTEGLIMALRARATIKSSFRVNKTIIAPVENNPLKFSVTSEDALNIIFADDRTGYMPATEAFSEGFKDLQTHQMAMMAGMQAIIKEITLQFSPQTLERKFEPQKSSSFIPSNKKAKNWEMYETFYKKMTDRLQDDFQNIYGEEFARAYENQVRKLM